MPLQKVQGPAMGEDDLVLVFFFLFPLNLDESCFDSWLLFLTEFAVEEVAADV